MISRVTRRFIMKGEKPNRVVELNTHLFGKITLDSSKILDFAEGLIGFNEYKRYVIIEDRKINPFRWLQCVDEPSLAFVIVNPQVVKPDYTIAIAREKISRLHLEKPEQALVYAVVVLSKDPKDMTANLRGPIIINRENRRGMQMIIEDEDYPTAVNIFEEVSEWMNSCESGGETPDREKKNSLVSVT
jgi:flagellar assembly factor FliW